MEDQKPEHNIFTRFAVKATKIATLPATAITAWFTGDVMVRNSLYKNFAKHGFFDGGQKIRSTEGVQGQYSKNIRTAVKETYTKKIADATGAERNRLASNAINYSVIDAAEKDAFLKKFNIEPSSIKKLSERTVPSIVENPETKTRVQKLLNTYRGDIREFFNDIDMKGMRDYSKGITRNQKTEAIVFAVSTAAITLGAALAIMTFGKEQQERLHEEKEHDHLKR